ncbi:UNVERIFIED_CONTAM: hypothetical protein FKN15_044868 [Acipenser sinensis]
MVIVTLYGNLFLFEEGDSLLMVIVTLYGNLFLFEEGDSLLMVIVTLYGNLFLFEEGDSLLMVIVTLYGNLFLFEEGDSLLMVIVTLYGNLFLFEEGDSLLMVIVTLYGNLFLFEENYAKGFGGRYGVQTDRMDKGAASFTEMEAPTSSYQKTQPVEASAENEYEEAPAGLCAVALYDYQGEGDDEISFDPDDIIRGIEIVDESWWKGQCRGRVGLFPATYVELMQ